METPPQMETKQNKAPLPFTVTAPISLSLSPAKLLQRITTRYCLHCFTTTYSLPEWRKLSSTPHAESSGSSAPDTRASPPCSYTLTWPPPSVPPVSRYAGFLERPAGHCPGLLPASHLCTVIASPGTQSGPGPPLRGARCKPGSRGSSHGPPPFSPRQHVRAPRTSQPACKPLVRPALTRHSGRSY